MELLEFARGPGLAFSLGVFGLGLAWRIAGIFRRPARVQLSVPRRTDVVAGGLRAIFAKMLPPKRVKTRVTAMANAYVYHLGIALVVLAFAPPHRVRPALHGSVVARAARLGHLSRHGRDHA